MGIEAVKWCSVLGGGCVGWFNGEDMKEEEEMTRMREAEEMQAHGHSWKMVGTMALITDRDREERERCGVVGCGRGGWRSWQGDGSAACVGLVEKKKMAW